jgi:hypothetical protein
VDAARQRLASLEAEFIRTLSADGPYSSGSDLRGMRATSQLLRAKRVRIMARAWPELVDVLGNGLAERATEALARTPLAPGDHAAQDGLMVARHLEAAGPIPDSLRLRMVGIRMRYRNKEGLLVQRRGPALGFAYLRQSGRLICALRVPGFRLLTISIRVGSRPWRSPVLETNESEATTGRDSCTVKGNSDSLRY